ncbi:MAG: hypothetical protein P4L41_17895 [Flavipsychrobacter sp.]|nr:hypothetical protein [Flavipsychrobacter sp.]
MRADSPPTNAPISAVTAINHGYPGKLNTPAIRPDKTCAFALSLHSAIHNQLRPTPRKPDKKDSAGFARVNPITMKATTAIIHHAHIHSA